MRMENKNESRHSCARAAVDCVYTLHTLRFYNVMLTKSVDCMADQNRLHGIPILYLFLKNSAFFGRPSALILPFLPFPRRNFEKRKGSPSFFQVSGKIWIFRQVQYQLWKYFLENHCIDQNFIMFRFLHIKPKQIFCYFLCLQR